MRRRLSLAFLLVTSLVSSVTEGASRTRAPAATKPPSHKPQIVKARSTRPTDRGRATAAAPRPRFPSVALFGAHVGEALAYQPRDERGRVKKEAAKQLERLLRCRQTGQRHRLHPRLGEALYQIGRHFSGHRVSIYSGFRPRAFCTRAHSRHMTGSAVDFHVEGVTNEALIAYLRKTFHPAGVGYYPHGVHVHLDLERSVDTYWVDPGPPTSDPVIAQPATPAAPEAMLPAPRDTAPAPAEALAPELGAIPAETEPEAGGAPEAAPLGEPPAADPELGELPRLPEAALDGVGDEAS